MIRDATAADAAALRRLHERVVPAYPLPEIGAEAVVLVAEEARGGLVGYLAGVVDGSYPGPGAPVGRPHGYVQTVAVELGHRCRGHGRALVEAFVARSRVAGARWVFALPDESEGVRQRAAFFRGCGFGPVHEPDEVWPAMGRST